MGVRGARDDDAGYRRIAQDRVEVHDQATRLIRERFGCRAVRIHDIFKRQFRRTRGIAGMDLSDPSRPDNGNVEHRHEYNEMLTSRCVRSLPDSNKNIDLIAVGRSSVDLYGEQVGGRLEDMGSFAKYVGGSPTNTPIASARLGLPAALFTRVGADHMGRFIREELVH